MNIKKLLKAVCISVCKFSNGVASANFCYQPKEPKGLKLLDSYSNGKYQKTKEHTTKNIDVSM